MRPAAVIFTFFKNTIAIQGKVCYHKNTPPDRARVFTSRREGCLRAAERFRGLSDLVQNLG